jgi:dihydrofolate reductase
MAKLTYTVLTSLDGFTEDEEGRFDWAMPDPEVHAYVNELARPIGTELYGRRMYETMAVWQTIGTEPGVEVHPAEADFAELWRSIDKVVYSRTLDAVRTPRTRLEREFDPEAVRRLKDTADHDISIGGPDLAAHAFRAGLIDDVHLFVFPVAVGGGKPALPRSVRLDLTLVDTHPFPDGTLHLHYTFR